MKASEMLDCTELVAGPDRPGTLVRCNAPAEVTRTAWIDSTDGPAEHIETHCVLGHRLFMSREKAS